ncbi:hypothetical protein TSO352_04490 [Azospirillum sp. TSO35-2]|nr:hypothetical protein TSO352_04490 [Azospirillum sp. TSO35-2]
MKAIGSGIVTGWENHSFGATQPSASAGVALSAHNATAAAPTVLAIAAAALLTMAVMQFS